VNNYGQGGEVWRYEPEIITDFSASPILGIVPLEVTFTNTSTGDLTSSLWDFGDGVTSTLTNPVHTYTTPGVYSVTLVAGSFGHTDTITKANLITVDPQKIYLPVIKR
jgi:PKD repeat protein